MMIRHYNQLTIKQFLKLKTIADFEADPLNRQLMMLSEISGQSMEELEQLPISELKDRLKEFANIEVIQHNERISMKFKVKGTRFECIWKTQELRAKQYLDATHFAKEDILQNIHNILAAICVKKTWYGRRIPYDGSKHEETAKLLYNHMKISQAYPILLFFCRYSEALENNTGTFLMGEIQKTREMFLSQRNGAGLLQ